MLRHAPFFVTARPMFRTLRIFVLLFILATVAVSTYRAKARATDWQSTLQVVVYPINGDGSRTAEQYISRITDQTFASIQSFIERESVRHGMARIRPVDIRVAPALPERPPSAPATDNILSIMMWSLETRYWAWQNDHYAGPRPNIRLFVSYFDGQQSFGLDNSVGLEKGQMAFVNAFALRDMTETNNVIIAHEMLHTLGATDKYDPATALPVPPDGFAEPDRSPLYPQEKAEIMGGRIPRSPSEADIPPSLAYAMIGPKTAAEIGWR